jgi:hypothetical protein
MTNTENTRSLVRRQKHGRSAVANGNRLLLGSDGRGMWNRLYRCVIQDHVDCYGGDLSVPRMSLLKRQAASLVECELIESRMADGKPTPEDLDRHTRIVGNVRRCYEALGMDRIAKPVNAVHDLKAISDYLSAEKLPEAAE